MNDSRTIDDFSKTPLQIRRKKPTFSQRVVNDWNRLTEESIHENSVNMSVLLNTMRKSTTGGVDIDHNIHKYILFVCILLLQVGVCIWTVL